MEPVLIQDETFEQIDYSIKALPKGEYDNCQFTNCNFSNANFSECEFSDCTFNSCNLSLAKLTKTTFRNIRFKDCKLLGLLFNDCNQFGLSFYLDNCNLTHASFYQTKLKKSNFKNTLFQEVDFVECDLSQSIFYNCDFSKAVFENTILEKVDLHTSYNYSINPETNNIKKAKFSLSGLAGLLDKYDIIIES